MGRGPLNDQETQVYSALKNSVLQSTVGVTAADEVMLGTGTMLSFGAFMGILTAWHVIENSNLQNLRFMAPEPDPGDAGVTLRSVSAINVVDLLGDKRSDLAFLLLGEPLSDDRFSNFRTLPEIEAPLPVGSGVMIVGYPHAFVNPTTDSRGRVARRVVENPVVVDSRTKDRSDRYDPEVHFLMTYPPAEREANYNPRGFSGGAVWRFDLSPRAVFAPVPVFCGVTTMHTKCGDGEALIAVRASVVRSFLQRTTTRISEDSGSNIAAEPVPGDRK
jgi:hypothetical protein